MFQCFHAYTCEDPARFTPYKVVLEGRAAVAVRGGAPYRSRAEVLTATPLSGTRDKLSLATRGGEEARGHRVLLLPVLLVKAKLETEGAVSAARERRDLSLVMVPTFSAVPSCCSFVGDEVGSLVEICKWLPPGSILSRRPE